MNRKILIILWSSFLCIVSNSQEKIPLTHSVYDNWQDIADFNISNDGKWVYFEQNPQKGDGFLVLINTETNDTDTIPRGNKAIFSPNSDFLVFKIRPQHDTIRKLKLNKVKKEKLPKDSLGIIVFGSDTIIKINRVKSFATFKDSSSWLVYLKEKPLTKQKKKETTSTDTEKKKTGKKRKKKIKNEVISQKTKKGKNKKHTTLVIYNPITGAKHSYKNIKEYSLDKTGKLIGFIRVVSDSTDTSFVFTFNTKTEQTDTIFYSQGLAKKIKINNNGNALAFIHSQDTVKNKSYCLYLWNNNKLNKIADTLTQAIPRTWTVSEFGRIYFSDDDTKLFFGTAPKPEPEKKDTILDEEKYKVDIWHWQDPYLQPKQKINLKKEKQRSYTAVYLIEKNKIFQLGDTVIRNVNIINNGNTKYAIGYNYLPYAYMQQWDNIIRKDYYLININTGEKQILSTNEQNGIQLSQGNKYIYWYDLDKQEWFVKKITANDTISLTKDINVNFYNEEHDIPSKPSNYGIAGWTKNDKYILIYDMFDIWKIDPEMKEKPYNLTQSFGRNNKIKFRNIWLDDDKFVLDNNENLLLKAFCEDDKTGGYYTININSKQEPQPLIKGKYYFRTPLKAKNAEKFLWRKENFSTYPDIYICNSDFSNIKKLSEANPQQSKYLWGTVELVKWKAYNGKPHEGLLYKPENFDTNKQYPMIVYFYEKYSDRLYRHYTPRPSRSVINFPYYLSNGYIIFIPDIHYGTGHPGNDAYNSVVSGTDFIVDKGFVDKTKIGIQGQSWGGYQVAYLITKTNKFAAAEAGAPVSNMTSAYGGIRWKSGMSRQFQYEKTQSRIGCSLWENRDLYIENSPVFFADKVNTPLLIMHNDKDGAVPWYQGIEYFTALRRLQKPVWMLSYNNEEHNLVKRPNCMDLSIRMSQFFDHFLKNAPPPEWLIKGRPATDKGKNDRYKPVEK